MGGKVVAGNCNIVINAFDNENFDRLELLENGEVIRGWSGNSSSFVITESLTVDAGDYYYVRIHQVDGDEAISSPIHIY
ncbi:MAG: hypothetical protein JW881_02445 [Spirochaetales bacterium]|nr:hypothetical protein [Spirochaetales bacterium]